MIETAGNTGRPGELVRVFTIANELGMHARPASLFVKTATRYKCDIIVEKDGTKVSGKSIIGLLTIEGSPGSKLKIIASGEDAEEALKALEMLFVNRFNED